MPYNEPIYKWDGSILRVIRNLSHLSIPEFSRKLDVLESQYIAIENGKKLPDLKLLIRIAEYSGASIDYLIGRSDVDPEFEEQLKTAHTEMFKDWLNGAPRPGKFDKTPSIWPYNVVEEVLGETLDYSLSSDQLAGFYAALETFEEREQLFLREYYEKNWTLEQIGRAHHFSREWPRQIIQKVISKLRRPPLREWIVYGKEGSKIHKESLDINLQIAKLERDKKKLEAIRNEYEQELRSLRKSESEIEMVTGNVPKPVNIPQYEDVSLEDLNLSFRSFSCLKRAGNTSLGDVINHLDEDPTYIFKVRNLGKRCVDEVYGEIFRITGIQYNQRKHDEEGSGEEN